MLQGLGWGLRGLTSEAWGGLGAEFGDPHVGAPLSNFDSTLSGTYYCHSLCGAGKDLAC